MGAPSHPEGMTGVALLAPTEEVGGLLPAQSHVGGVQIPTVCGLYLATAEASVRLSCFSFWNDQ